MDAGVSVTGSEREIGTAKSGGDTGSDTGSVVGREEVREIAVGAAAVLAFAAVLLLSYFGFGGRGNSSAYVIYASFNRVDGLAVGDEVDVGGVPVGRVAGMTIGDNYRARVALQVERGLVLPADTSASINTDGLFGRKYVVLEPGGDEEQLKDGSVITFTQGSLIVSELLELIIAEGRAQRTPAAEKPK